MSVDKSIVKINSLLCDSISTLSIGEIEIYTAIKFLNNTKSAGPNNLPTYILKGCTYLYLLIYPLKVIFNLSIQTGTFPNKWKNTKVCPLFKSGNMSKINKY